MASPKTLRPRLLSLALLLLGSAPALALQTPWAINFQGKLLDKTTNDPVSGEKTMTFKIYDSPAGPTPLFTDGPRAVTVVNGVFSVGIGTNSPLSIDLFAHASAYIGVTVAPDAEMLPRQQLIMTPYAFTANQLVYHADIRVNAGPTYSTFTAKGNLEVPYGVSAGTASFSGSLTASSGTFAVTGDAQYSVQTASGILMSKGLLKLTGSAGLDASDTGIAAATATFSRTGSTQYSLYTSSGISMAAGTADISGALVVASTAIFRGTGQAAYSIYTSSGIEMARGLLDLTGSAGIDASDTGISAATATFRRTGSDQYSLYTSSGIDMAKGLLDISGSAGIDASDTGIMAATGTFGGIMFSSPTALVNLTAANTLLTLGSRSYFRLTSNNTTSTNRTLCLPAGAMGQIIILEWADIGANEGQILDGTISGAAPCDVASGAKIAQLSAVWPATANQANDTIVLIYNGGAWLELDRTAN